MQRSIGLGLVNSSPSPSHARPSSVLFILNLANCGGEDWCSYGYSSGADPGIYHGGGARSGPGRSSKSWADPGFQVVGGGGGGVQFRWMKSAGGGGGMGSGIWILML